MPLWEVDYLCQGRASASWASPVVRGNRLVVPGRDETRDLVFGLDPETGDLLWLGSYEAAAGKTHGPGPRATPYIDGTRAYTFGRSGDLACWNIEDGSELWRVNVKDQGGVEPRWGFASSPLVVGGVLADGDYFTRTALPTAVMSPAVIRTKYVPAPTRLPASLRPSQVLREAPGMKGSSARTRTRRPAASKTARRTGCGSESVNETVVECRNGLGTVGRRAKRVEGITSGVPVGTPSDPSGPTRWA